MGLYVGCGGCIGSSFQSWGASKMSKIQQRVQDSIRASFDELRDELHARAVDLDLAEVWSEMNRDERSVVLRAAGLLNMSSGKDRKDEVRSMPLLGMSREDRAAIRSAITRMSNFASRLRDGCQKYSVPPHVELAQQASKALESGDALAARHFLGLIESL